MTNRQTFTDPGTAAWLKIEALPGVELMPLAEPVPQGSIHRARLAAGTVIPVHTHPADEFVQVLSGTIETGGRRCEAGRPARGRALTSPSATSNCSRCGSARWGRSGKTRKVLPDKPRSASARWQGRIRDASRTVVQTVQASLCDRCFAFGFPGAASSDAGCGERG